MTTNQPSARTLARLRRAASHDSWRTLSRAATDDLVNRGLFDYDTWSLTPLGKDTLKAADAPAPAPARSAVTTTETPARDLATGMLVRMHDGQVGTHLREVNEARMLPGFPAAVLVDWVGDDLAPTVWHPDWPVEVVSVQGNR